MGTCNSGCVPWVILVFKIYFVYEMLSFGVLSCEHCTDGMWMCAGVSGGEGERDGTIVKSGSGKVISFIIYDALDVIHNAQASLAISMLHCLLGVTWIADENLTGNQNIVFVFGALEVQLCQTSVLNRPPNQCPTKSIFSQCSHQARSSFNNLFFSFPVISLLQKPNWFCPWGNPCAILFDITVYLAIASIFN